MTIGWASERSRDEVFATLASNEHCRGRTLALDKVETDVHSLPNDVFSRTVSL